MAAIVSTAPPAPAYNEPEPEPEAPTIEAGPNGVRYLTYVNNNDADIVYPALYLTAADAKPFWNGADTPSKYTIQRKGTLRVDLTEVTGAPKEGQPFYVGVTIAGQTKTPRDKSKTYEFDIATRNDVTADYYNEKTVITHPTAAAEGLSLAKSIAAQQATPNIAKLLVALATLISPEVY